MSGPISDTELIHRIRKENDSAALSELTNRHTGLYISIAQKYSGFSDKIQIEEIKDDRQYNMYQWVIKYEPDRGMKFSTFVGQMTKYMCLDLMNQTPDKVEMTEYHAPVSEDNVSESAADKDTVVQIKDQVTKVDDPRFWEIFKLYHVDSPSKSWRAIGKRMNLTHEGARKIYLKYIDQVKEYIQT